MTSSCPGARSSPGSSGRTLICRLLRLGRTLSRGPGTALARPCPRVAGDRHDIVVDGHLELFAEEVRPDRGLVALRDGLSDVVLNDRGLSYRTVSEYDYLVDLISFGT